MNKRNEYRIAQITRGDETQYFQLQVKYAGKEEWTSVYANDSIEKVREVREERKARDENYLAKNAVIVE